MATITSAQSGNWSDPNTWVGGVVPTVGDDVVLSASHQVAVDVANVDINSLARSGTGSANLTVSINCNLNIDTISFSQGGPSLIMINGTGTNVSITSSSILSGGVPSTAVPTNSAAISITAVCNVLIITGEIVMSNGSTGNANIGTIGVSVNAAATVDIVVGLCYQSPTGLATQNSRNRGIYVNGAATVSITGTFISGAGATNSNYVSIEIASANAIVTFNGIINAGTGLSDGLLLNGNSSLIVDSSIINASNQRCGIVNASGQVTLAGVVQMNNVDGNAALFARNVRLLSTSSVAWKFNDEVNTDIFLYTADQLTGYPTEADVRSGEVYGPVGEFTGTLSPVNIDVQQLASDLLTEMNASNLPIAQGLRDGMGASAAAIAAVGSIQAIP